LEQKGESMLEEKAANIRGGKENKESERQRGVALEKGDRGVKTETLKDATPRKRHNEWNHARGE